jgi:TorA maturation chaperone TorD
MATSEREIFSERSVDVRSRANVYVLLSRLFSREVDDALLEWLSSEETLSTLASLEVDTSPLATCHVKEDSPEKEDLLDDLAAEYAALFILPGDLSPYESVRLKGQLCQEPEWKVRQFYLDCGLVVKENTKIFADHIGAELGFMAYLTEKEADALDSGDDEAVEKWQGAQSGFFVAHLGCWVFSFLDDMERFNSHPFYSVVVQLTRNFLQVECEDLAPQGAQAGGVTP